MALNFTVKKECLDTKARLGTLKTRHVEVTTPIFMPVGTHGAVRSQRTSEIADLGYELLLANTYHLILRPGIEYFEKFGELRKFAGWGGGFLTDSGGFQIFSLSASRQISEEGAHFRSHIDGKKLLLTPELSIQAQRKFGSDIMMVLDECVASTVEKAVAAKAMHLTHRWAARSLIAAQESDQGLFGIVQGACFEDLRIESAQTLARMNFSGIAIGGLAVGESRIQREEMCRLVTTYLPREKPRYLMGVGTPLDILQAVAAGVDMFDCVLPTMLGQQGVAFTDSGKIDLRKSIHFDLELPIDAACNCYVCRTFSRRYLHHLVKTYDVSAQSLIGFHNLAYFAGLMRDIRSSLAQGKFAQFYQEKIKLLHDVDISSREEALVF